MTKPAPFRPPSFLRRLFAHFRTDRRLAVAWTLSTITLATTTAIRDLISPYLFWSIFSPTLVVQAFLSAAVFLRSRSSEAVHDASRILRCLCRHETSFNQHCLNLMREGASLDIESVVKTFLTTVAGFVIDIAAIPAASLDVHVMSRVDGNPWAYEVFGVNPHRQRTDAGIIMNSARSIARSAMTCGGVRFAPQKLKAGDYLTTTHDKDVSGRIKDGSIYCRHYWIEAGSSIYEFILSIKSYDDYLMCDPCDEDSVADTRFALDHLSGTLEKLLKYSCLFHRGRRSA